MSTEIRETEESTAAEPVRGDRDTPVFRPRADIREGKGGVTLTLEMPGVGPEGVDIDLDRRVLTIRGRGRVTRPEGFRQANAEYAEGDYERVFTLSEEIDEAAIRAGMANGVLTLELPRAEAAKPRRIEVRAG